MAEAVLAIPTTLDRYRIPRHILQASAETLRNLSAGVREAVVLWQGRIVSSSLAEVTKLHVPLQDTSRFHFDVPLHERLRLIREVSTANEFIIIQLHTHPKQAFHSQADDRMAITKHLGAISIVVPDFGARWTGDLSDTAVFMHKGRSVWLELSTADIRALFEIIP